MPSAVMARHTQRQLISKSLTKIRRITNALFVLVIGGMFGLEFDRRFSG
jgi:hypothetical protein